MSENYYNIDGVVIKSLEKYSDYRGWLVELFREDELPDGFNPAMSYISMTKPGETRGPHEHKEQIDYFCILGPSTFSIYFWDNRLDSRTFKNRFKIKAGEDNIIAIMVPPGVVHAYKNIGNNEGFIVNSPNRLYAGQGKKELPDEIRYENQPDNEFELF